MLKTFIERPVLSTVISIIIVLLGVISISSLPIEEYPDIAPPTIKVTANYTGANAETVLESVIIPIEEQINGVEGMTYITSTASNTGTAEITVYFDQNIDADIAAVNVQNRVARATPLLPSEVTQTGIITQKQETSVLMFISMYSESENYDATFIQNYLKINVIPAMQRISGVGDVSVFSQQDYAMRIWLNPEKLASYGLIPSDISAALAEQNLEAAAGSLGQNNGESFSYTLTYSGRFKDESQYSDIVIKALGNGEFLRLKDVATIELDAQSYSSNAMSLGNPAVFMGIFQTKGSNAQEIIENIKITLEQVKADLPEGLDIFVPYDTSLFLNASIDKVVTTLLEAFLLVFLVVFIFLQDFRSTLIPAIAVFIPVTFVTGPTGVFYEQFGVTLIIAILISAVNALTLSPALCALLLKEHKDDEELKGKSPLKRFYTLFNRGFNATVERYGRSLQFLYKRKFVSVLLLVITGIGIYWASNTTPTGFVPNEDRGIIFANIELPPGASLDRTDAVARKLYEKVEGIEGIVGVNFIKGRSLISGAGSNFGFGIIKLKDWSERKDDALSAQAITGRLFGIAATIPDANIIFFSPPSIRGFGNSAGFEINLLDKFGGEFSDLDKAKNDFTMALMQRPEIKYATSSFNTNYPQYEMDVNVPLAKEKGVSVTSIFSTLQGYIGGIYASDFSKFGKQFRVYIQALPEDRADESALNSMYVRTDSGEMTPITQFVNLKRVYGPQSVTRFNLFNSTSITGATNDGFSTGDAIRVIEEEVAKLPSNYTVSYSGLTREEVNAGNQTTFIFILSILFVYFLLSAQYESYLLPFAVVLSLPFGVFGAYISTKFLGLENNIYFQIALIMLIGLLAKNAILIVEFALQRRKHGESIVEAAINGAKARLRPILMTSFAFILGLMPLVLANGVGAEGNNSIGTGAAGGMLIGTILGVFVIPILFILFQWLQEKVSSKPAVKTIEE